MIKVLKHDKKEDILELETDMPVYLANAIRRSVLEIPTLAVDEVEISQNDSALFDEVISHRIGLIPIKTDKTTKEARYKLKKTGPCIVYSTDFKPDFETGLKIPITILDEEQEIELIANAKLGTGNEHVKFSPGMIYYKHNIDDDVIDFVSIKDGKIIFNEDELKVDAEKLNKIKKLKYTNELIISVESWGQIDAKSIFARAIEVLDKNLQGLSKEIK